MLSSEHNCWTLATHVKSSKSLANCIKRAVGWPGGSDWTLARDTIARSLALVARGVHPTCATAMGARKYVVPALPIKSRFAQRACIALIWLYAPSARINTSHPNKITGSILSVTARAIHGGGKPARVKAWTNSSKRALPTLIKQRTLFVKEKSLSKRTPRSLYLLHWRCGSGYPQHQSKAW